MSVDPMSAQNEFAQALKDSPEIVRQAFNAQTDNWNKLIWALSKLAKQGEPYEGETAEELLAMLEALVKAEPNMYDVARRSTDEALGDGSYAELNRHNPDPGVQAAIKRYEQEKGQ